MVRTLAAFMLLSISVLADDLEISNARRVPMGDAHALEVTVHWKNAWRNAKNHDAAWLFAKANARNGSVHLRFKPGTYDSVTGSPQGTVVVPPDGAGAFVSCKSEHRGAVTWTVRIPLAGIAWDPESLRVFGVEMVCVPGGPFWVGSAQRSALRYGSYYTEDAEGKQAQLHVTSEAQIEVGSGPGMLNYPRGMYHGDRQGPIPETFPKGTRTFYCMKYELRQGQYVEFLNQIPAQASAFRANFANRLYVKRRGTIYLDGDTFRARRPVRPCNFISWDDGCAFADWAGLRPMTDFEYAKACRGPDPSSEEDFPWGTASKEKLQRNVGADGDLAIPAALGQGVTDENREVVGASYYWIMDLAGSVWERVVSAGHPRGRAFKGTHGDGKLTGQGRPTNADWPLGDEGKGGYGYRGGGYY